MQMTIPMVLQNRWPSSQHAHFLILARCEGLHGRRYTSLGNLTLLDSRGWGCAVHSHAGVMYPPYTCLNISWRSEIRTSKIVQTFVRFCLAKSFKLQYENARADLVERFWPKSASIILWIWTKNENPPKKSFVDHFQTYKSRPADLKNKDKNIIFAAYHERKNTNSLTFTLWTRQNQKKQGS